MVPHAEPVYCGRSNARVSASPDAAASGAPMAVATTGIVQAAPATIVRRWTPSEPMKVAPACTTDEVSFLVIRIS